MPCRPRGSGSSTPVFEKHRPVSGVVIPISGKRPKRAVDPKANKAETRLVSAKKMTQKFPKDDLNKVGTVARILKMIKMPDGRTRSFFKDNKDSDGLKSFKKSRTTRPGLKAMVAWMNLSRRRKVKQ